MPEPWRTILTLVAGFVTGVMSGMFGVGGAVVSNPAIRALGASPIQSVGSTLPSILPSAISGALRYHREGLLRMRIVIWTGLSGAVASIGGSLLSAVVPDARFLTLTIALLIMYTAIRTGLAARPAQVPADESEVVGRDVPTEAVAAPADSAAPRLVAIGLVAGLFSGLLGIGGGLLLVPAFLTFLRLPLKETLGTSLACVGIIAVPGTVTHAALGHIDWGFAIPLSIAVIPGARVGAALAIRASDRALRLAVATALSAVAIVYATSEVVALL
ncbi:MAG TPA: sulfite exporter TauE/SafE family protein [Acidimicrobiia bacterium]